MRHDGSVNIFASYKVAAGVDNHEAYGLEIYLHNRDTSVNLNSAMEVPRLTTKAVPCGLAEKGRLSWSTKDHEE